MIDHNRALSPGFLPTADQFLVSLDGLPLRVVRYAQFDVPIYLIHASPAPGAHRVSVRIKRKHSNPRLHPARLGIRLEQEDRALAFAFSDYPHLVLECEGVGFLLFAFDPPQADPSGPGVVDAAALGVLPHPDRVQTSELQRALDRVSGNTELRTLRLGPGIYRSGDLHLRGGCRLHLASGAVIRAADQAAAFGGAGVENRLRPGLINADGADGISITGHGHIDGNRSVLDLDRYYGGMIRLTHCRDVRLDGPVFSDSCGWNTMLRHCSDVVCHRLKILNNRPEIDCINTDGINPVSSSRVRIEHCLMHTGDDAVAVKSLPSGDSAAADVADITVTDLLAINNSSTAKIGTETMAARMERIRFERIDAVRTWRLIAIDAYDHALIRDVAFIDCHAHFLDGAWRPAHLFDLNAPAAGNAFRPNAGRGRIEQVRLARISSDTPGRCTIAGHSEEYGVHGVALESARIGGVPVPPEDIEVNEFVRDLAVADPVPVASAVSADGGQAPAFAGTGIPPGASSNAPANAIL